MGSGWTVLGLLLAWVMRGAGHNWLLVPTPRVIGQDGLYGAGDELKNCGSDSTDVPSDSHYQRGGQIEASWVYNNHWGGFARFAILPLGQEQDVKAMNDPSNFLKIVCHTGTCGGRAQSLDGAEYDYFKPYNLPAQHVELDFSSPRLACNTSITVPARLKDGTYVLQWIVYGLHDSLGKTEMAIPFYRSCANIQIQGGSGVTDQPSGSCNFDWQGGDKALQDPDKLDTSQCSYWKFNSINSTLSDKYYDGGGELFANEHLTQIDATALRHGPPAEVAACGGKVGIPNTSKSPSITTLSQPQSNEASGSPSILAASPSADEIDSVSTSSSENDPSPASPSSSESSATPTNMADSASSSSTSNQRCRHKSLFLKVQTGVRKRWLGPRAPRRRL